MAYENGLLERVTRTDYESVVHAAYQISGQTVTGKRLLIKLLLLAITEAMLRLYLLSASTQIFLATLIPYFQIILRNKGFSQSIIGVIMAVSQLFALGVPLVLGSMLDRNGKAKKYMLFGALSALVGLFLCIRLTAVSVVVLIFVVMFCAYSCINPTVDCYITNVLSKNPGRYGSIRAVGSFGYVVTLVTFALVKFPDASQNSQIVLATCGGCLLFCLMTVAAPGTEVSVKEKNTAKNGFRFSWFDTGFYSLILIILFEKLGNSVIEKLLGSYMTEVLNLGSSFTAFVALGALSEVFMMLIAGKLLIRGEISEWFLITISCAVLFVRLTLYYVSQNLVVFAIAQMLHSFTFGAIHVAYTSYVTKNVDVEHRGLAMSIYWAIGIGLPELVGALAGGFIIDSLGYFSLFRIYSVFPVIAVALCLFFKKKIYSHNV